jgi:hypothetical protein
VCVCVCERERVCVRERECVCERERECVCVCVRERERVCVCVCVTAQISTTILTKFRPPGEHIMSLKTNRFGVTRTENTVKNVEVQIP